MVVIAILDAVRNIGTIVVQRVMAQKNLYRIWHLCHSKYDHNIE